MNRCDADAKPELRAERLMRGQEERRHFGRDGAAERPVRDFHHRHLAAERQRRRGDLQPDESGADDDDAAPGAQGLPDRLRVADRAQAEYAFEIDAGRAQGPLPRAGREDQMIVSRAGARGELDQPRRAVDPLGLDPKAQIDAMVDEEFFRA